LGGLHSGLISSGAAVVHDQFKPDGVLDKRRQEVKARLARETRIGWPILVLVAVLLVTSLSVLLYLVLDR
jgi:hypothetical protein